MKRKLLLIFGLALSMGLFAQQIDREKVLVEIGTATWCGYCPGAAMGAEDLVENGHDVAVIEYHTSDSYSNNEASARASYYGISGIPDAYFDGVLNVGGGSATQSMYSYYLPKYNQRIAIPSSFDIEMEVSSSGLDYTVEVTVTKVAEYSGSNLVFQLALTESNIEENWQNQTHLHWVERLMAPSANGTPLDFSSSDTQSFTLNFTIDPSWDIEFCELAGFVQANSSKEVMQTKLSILATPEFSVDAEVLNIFDTPEESCSGKMAPKVTIRNRGEEHLTSLEVEYTVNNSAPVSYNWTGDLDFLGKDSFELPEITFEEAETNVVEVTVLNPNGQEDQNPNNNVTTTEVASAETIDPVSYLILRTDNNPQETTWELTNSAGEVIYNGGPYSEPMKMNRDTFQLYTTDCYRITIYDSGNNGLCCGSGTGFVRVINSDMQTVVYAMEFTDKYVGEFNVNSIGISALSQEFAVEIYPNPLNDVANIVLNLREASEVQITAFDLMGKKVLEQNEGKLPEGTSTLTLDATNLTKGVYILRIHAGESVLSQKITIK